MSAVLEAASPDDALLRSGRHVDTNRAQSLFWVRLEMVSLQSGGLCSVLVTGMFMVRDGEGCW